MESIFRDFKSSKLIEQKFGNNSSSNSLDENMYLPSGYLIIETRSFNDFQAAETNELLKDNFKGNDEKQN